MITLLPYNSLYPSLFQQEKSALTNIFHPIKVHIEHIGSTAIPGIQSKPVIDILIGIDNLSQIDKHVFQRIESLGYQYISAFEVQFPYRRYFQKNDIQGNRTHQVHLVNYSSAWWQKHILFRDYLLTHPDIAQEYETKKLTLALQFIDTVPYAIAKTEFCQKIDNLAFHDFTMNVPFIETERCKAYIPQLACLKHYTGMLADKDVIACYGVTFLAAQARERLLSDMEHWNQNSFGPWMWYDKHTNDYIGRVGLKKIELENQLEIELAYAIKPSYWGKGIAAEMSKAALNFAFTNLDIDNLLCFTLTTNKQSLRVMEKLGFQYQKNFIYKELPHKLYRLEKKIF